MLETKRKTTFTKWKTVQHAIVRHVILHTLTQMNACAHLGTPSQTCQPNPQRGKTPGSTENHVSTFQPCGTQYCLNTFSQVRRS